MHREAVQKTDIKIVMEKGLKLCREFADDFGISKSFIDCFLGEYLGGGVHRDVFVYAPDPKYVIKVEKGLPEANVVEFKIWETIAHCTDHKWFARCKFISDCGRILVQERTKPIKPKKFWKLSVPTFFTDIKPENFGMIGDQLVAHDYDASLIRFMYLGMPDKMKKTKKYKK